ncbi:hypothetical protein [Lactiplantibacillus plantarum]|uniref:hypothetical protein n=1 Tax=Lactiplantibacillus plantarum TaxID=1590 RepID=UPI000E092027|nr:hypothetical protein [Lactiplantibacillus plantarum]AXH04990.1 hypothetical protein CEB41_11140 [Lactiplantibacillus plantarum]MBP5842316.1 hypothetical protein [Lactiplantibacillus plantarum]MCG0567661.1 SinR family protein [Lactiplantibacillus plantarum]MCG0614026.1 SinR family protein [Lactiplantibacillus plantarum]MCG0709758.1 SinR family protein [Lactiplantibacillus plantarum]
MSEPYMLTYDLDNPGQRYKEIKETIENKISNGTWCHFWDSTYLLRSDLSASEMMDKLKDNVDGNDRFFITKIFKDDYAGWLTEKEWDYVNDHIFS